MNGAFYLHRVCVFDVIHCTFVVYGAAQRTSTDVSSGSAMFLLRRGGGGLVSLRMDYLDEF